MSKIFLKVFNITTKLIKALLINRLQVQGGANLTNPQFGGHCYPPFPNADPLPSLLLQHGEQLPGTITISWLGLFLYQVTILSLCKSNITWPMRAQLAGRTKHVNRHCSQPLMLSEINLNHEVWFTPDQWPCPWSNQCLAYIIEYIWAMAKKGCKEEMWKYLSYEAVWRE